MGACAYFMPSTEHKLKVPKLQDAVGHTVETDRWLPLISRVYFPSKGRSLPKLCKSCANCCVCYRQLVVSRVIGQMNFSRSHFSGYGCGHWPVVLLMRCHSGG